MPVTHAHPAAVLPLIVYGRRTFSASALVIGSISPDIPFFFFSAMERKETHNLSGIFLWCLPIGICIYVLYHWLLRPALLDFFCSKNSVTTSCSLLTTTRLVISGLIVGAATHNFWDSLTHGTGWFAQHYHIFNQYVWLIRPIPLFRALQYLSGIFGTLIVAWFLIRTLKRDGLINWDDRMWRKRFMIRILGLAFIAGAFGVLFSYHYVRTYGNLSDSPWLHQLLRNWVIASTDFLLALGLLRGLQLRWNQRINSKFAIG